MPIASRYGLEHHGLTDTGPAHWNLAPAVLAEHFLARGLGSLSRDGALVVKTGKHTGRAAQDKFLVEEPSSKAHIWWGPVNKPIAERSFEQLHALLCAYYRGREVYVRDCYAGADPDYRLKVRVIAEHPHISLFAANMFIAASDDERRDFRPEFVVLQAPGCTADPKVHGTRSETFIVPHFGRGLTLIGGTGYAGEVKKSVFTALNYLLPLRGVMSMHASANVGPAGDVAIFFGLSGTGKTTLSTDARRTLIGDDEHGWGDGGVFNYEGGCYAKVIRLSREAEPEIYACTERFGTLLENVALDEHTRAADLDSEALTENTRASYPLHFIPNASATGRAGHAATVLMLTCDAFGVMPPIARMAPAQAMYHFISGYTAKVAGTEIGVKEPQATFSTCFGAPFMALHPFKYAELLRARLARHGATCWMVNTGWSGGPYGVGTRMRIQHTRALVNAAIDGALKDAPFRRDPVFGFEVPAAAPGVPAGILDPRATWPDGAAYDAKARHLAGLFAKNFAPFAAGCTPEVIAAGPRG